MTLLLAFESYENNAAAPFYEFAGKSASKINAEVHL